MSEQFDPYYKWLGIPPKDQPPNHYRLLGIELFEGDRDVIDAAANRLMSYLHEIAVGEEVDQSQKILNEVSAARVCLLDHRQKSAYDTRLKKKQAAAVAKPPRTASPPKSASPPRSASPPPTKAPPVTPPPPPRQTPPAGPRSAASDSSINVPVPAIQTTSDPATKPSANNRNRTARNRGNRKPNSQDAAQKQKRLMIIAGVVGVALVGVLVGLLIYGASDSATSVVLEIPEAARSDVRVAVDGKKYKLPVAGKAALAVDAGEHALVLERRGYQRIDHLFKVRKGKSYTYKPKWIALATASFATPQQPQPTPNNQPTANSPSTPNTPAPNPASVNALQAPAIPDDVVLPTDFSTPLVYLPFNVDGSNSGTIGNTADLPPTELVEGISGRGVLLKKGHVAILSKPLLREGDGLTISLWVKMNSVPLGRWNLVNLGGAQLLVNNRNLEFQLAGTAAKPMGPSIADRAQKWTSILLDYSRETGQSRLFINGAVAGNVVWSTPPPLNLSKLVVGKYAGVLDEVHVFGRTLSANEIRELTDLEPTGGG